MQIKAVSIEVAEFNKAKLRKQITPAVDKLMEAIMDLNPGRAKVIRPENNETATEIRNAAKQAAQLLGIEIEIALNSPSQIMLHLSTSEEKYRLKALAEKRSKRIREIAGEIAGMRFGSSNDVVDVNEIVEELQKRGIQVGVSRPTTTVTLVLRAIKGIYEHVGPGKFKIVGVPSA